MIDPLESAQHLLKGAGWDGLKPALVVLGGQQRLYCLENGSIGPGWPVSTGSAGFGNQLDSGCTPIGVHRICACIGAESPVGMVFRGRQPTGEIIGETVEPGRDLITTRILWLDGLEPGVNRGPGIDSRERYIYIHGTPYTAHLGTPVSAGCVRMDNQPILALFERVQVGTLVLIVPSE